MTARNWWDGMNLLYFLLTRHKQRGFLAMLERKIRKIEEKEGWFFVSVDVAYVVNVECCQIKLFS